MRFVRGHCVGLSTLSSALCKFRSVRYVYEPYLIQQGLIMRTPKGRQATDRAFEHMGVNRP